MERKDKGGGEGREDDGEGNGGAGDVWGLGGPGWTVSLTPAEGGLSLACGSLLLLGTDRLPSTQPETFLWPVSVLPPCGPGLLLGESHQLCECWLSACSVPGPGLGRGLESAAAQGLPARVGWGLHTRAEGSEEPGGMSCDGGLSTAGDAATQVRLSKPNPESASHLGEQGKGSGQRSSRCKGPEARERACVWSFMTCGAAGAEGTWLGRAGLVLLGRRVGVNSRRAGRSGNQNCVQ